MVRKIGGVWKKVAEKVDDEMRKRDLLKSDPARDIRAIIRGLSVAEIEKLLLKEIDPLLRALVMAQMEAAYSEVADDWSRVRSTIDDRIAEAVDRSSSQIKTAGAMKDRLVMRLNSMPSAGADELVEMIRREFKHYSESGARRIAQTTATAATGKAQVEAWADFEGTEHWLTTRGPRRRDDHANADGRKKVDGFFHVGGDKLEHPGDPSGKARNIINCQCTEFFQLK